MQPVYVIIGNRRYRRASAPSVVETLPQLTPSAITAITQFLTRTAGGTWVAEVPQDDGQHTIVLRWSQPNHDPTQPRAYGLKLHYLPAQDCFDVIAWFIDVGGQRREQHRFPRLTLAQLLDPKVTFNWVRRELH
jgi:hypothetical protein